MTITGRLVLIAFGLALTDAASAADIPVKAPAFAPPPVVDWSGVYAGVHAGYGGGMTDWTPGGLNYPAAGFLGGGQIGINKQIASLVFGVELEGSWANIGGSQRLVDDGIIGGATTVSANSRIEGMATFAGRAGLAADRWFVFAKGGLTGVWEKHSFGTSGVGLLDQNASSREFRIAPMIGFGAEYALDAHWSVKAEYDYLHFGSRTVPFNGLAGFGGVANLAIAQDSVHLVKLGANYRLGPVAVDSAYPPVKAAPGTNWTGAFVGVQGGYGFGRMDRSSFIDPAAPGSGVYDLKGWLGGIDGGVNVQSGVLVFGVEGEWMWTGLRGGQTFTTPDPFFGGTAVTTLNSRIDWLAIASAKAGFVVGDRLLIYGKGGVAIASERHSANSLETFLPAPGSISSATSGTAIHSGFALGAGAEYALGGNWSIKGEYNYIKMIAQQDTVTGVVTFSGGPTSNIARGFDRVGQDLQLFKLGVNYHLNPLPGAVTARY
ncbi:outer membrane protein [Bradyrhizobium liaoningense]|uniref:outer membrane protein n=1 Tax=Bradyrhizobium liaoningense TaxID=43992 RepID=UPI001BAC5E88|nr:outer membrane beta-barrel protein [Bradyrhizobium liaoningense]MBR0719084.1 porin family protein [Bradyrhizobium liaoningense]